MRLERSTGLAVRLVALSGVLSLVLTLEAPLWISIPALGLIIGGMVRPEAFGRLRLSPGAQTAGAIGGLVYSIADFFFIGGSLIAAAADFLTILVCLKLLSPGSYRDNVQLIGAGFFLLLSSTGLSTEIYFLAPFLMFFVSAAWAMMLLTIRSEAEARGAAMSGWRIGKGFFAGTAGLTLAALVSTLAIFMSIPRVGIGYFSKQLGGLIHTSGFSDTVELGSVGEIKLDPGTVMRIDLTGYSRMPDFPLYWRGRAFDRYENDRWSDTRDDVRPFYRGRMGVFYIDHPRSGDIETVEQNISLEPLDTSTIFALSPAYRLETNTGHGEAAFRVLFVDPSGAMRLENAPGSRQNYTVLSAKPVPPGTVPAWMKGSSPERMPAGVESLYLQLPEGSGRIRELAARLTEGIDGAMGRAMAVQSHLESNSTYSLDPARDTSLDPIDDFLFSSRQGYCEHFATAMVLLVRASGTPARLVSGFSGGEWNGMGGYLIVRERDAHTWVEVYEPGYGWITYDPTPPAAAEERSGVAAAFGGFLDYLKYKWDKNIVYYNLRDQLGTIGKASDTYYDAKAVIDKLTSELGNALKPASLARGLSGGSLGYLLGLACLLVAAGVGAMLLLRYRRYGSLRPGVMDFYAELERMLARRGVDRLAGETPLEYASRASERLGGPFKGAVYVARAYYRVRFGGLSLGRDERQMVREALDGMRDASR